MRLSLGLCWLWLAFLNSSSIAEEAVGGVGGCRGRGFKNSTTGICECASGFHGYECQHRYCPFGPSWNSMPLASHERNTENVACSNMGDCDRASGTCVCRPGFEGRACERMACPGRPFRSVPHKQVTYPVDASTDVGTDGGSYFEITPGTKFDLPPFEDGSSMTTMRRASAGVTAQCSGHGLCRSIREAGMQFNGQSLVRPWVRYDQWDADKMQGCLCDPGWDGYDCSFRACPKGRDPFDDNRAYDKDETFTIECQADEGYIALQVFGDTTIPIPFDAGPEYLRRVLKELPSVKGEVTVEMQENNDGLPTLCEAVVASRTTFSFANMPGALPPIRIIRALGASRQLKNSNMPLKLAGSAAPIAVVTKYTISCGECVDCFGNLHFTYGDDVSVSVDAIATGAAAAIVSAIEGMADFADAGWPEVEVAATITGASDAVCQADASSVEINIKSDMGNVHGLGMKDGVYLHSQAYVTKGFSNYGMNLSFVASGGNGTLFECSNQGTCDHVNGRCQCDVRSVNSVEAFRAESSDGTGFNRGITGDCSHVRIALGFGCAYSLNATNPSDVCGGHGTCDTASNQCMCDPGWGGVECSHFTCPADYPFFSEPVSASKTRPERVECSGEGRCDRRGGRCLCRDGFTGPACQIFDCPRDPVTGEECSGGGYCENMHDTYALHGLSYGKLRGYDPQRPNTWDAVRMRQCVCSGKRSDNHYAHPRRASVGPKTGVGRWETGGRPLPGFGGWACHQKLCPRGHSKMQTNTNYLMYTGPSSEWPEPRREVVRIVCALDRSTEAAVSFTLNYYGFESGPIFPSDDADAIKAAVEANPAIGNVTITMDLHATHTGNMVGTRACDATGTYTTNVGFQIRFDTEGGNHATPTVTVSDSSQAGDLSVEPLQDGNSELLECGGDKLGYCDYTSGLCQCMPGRGSSDQAWGIGDTGDCGYRHSG